jgi:hypothetical protein
MNNYLVMRKPQFSSNGIIVKRRKKNKGLSETGFNQKPRSHKLQKGDVVYIYETKYGIYAKGFVNQVDDIVRIDNLVDAIKFYSKNKLDSNYWMEQLVKFNNKKSQNKKMSINYQEYFIDQTLLPKTVPLVGELETLKHRQGGITGLDKDTVKLIEKNPLFQHLNKLDPKIPMSLKQYLYSLFNTNLKISHLIDIDHFVPESLGGPGNIIENLVPIGLSLNRYKSNSIPSGFFQVANSYESLKSFVKVKYKDKLGFIRGDKNAEAQAEKINQEILEWPINDAKEFYKKVLEKHHPEYVKIIDEFEY